MNKTLTTAQLTAWIDAIRHHSAEGQFYANNDYDRKRYAALQTLAMEMTAFLVDQPIQTLEPFRSSFFACRSPMVAGAAAVIDASARILLMRRSDNGLWSLPAAG